jgi:hypothetical protein
LAQLVCRINAAPEGTSIGDRAYSGIQCQVACPYEDTMANIHMTKKILRGAWFLPILTLLCWALAIGSARAQTPGIRAGVTGEPTQFHFGGHLETEPLIEQLTFRPNVEAGVGDDQTLIAFNVEFAYGIPLRNQPWRVYLGGGPALVLVDRDEDGRGRDDDSDVGGGFNVMVGLEHNRGLFFEFKVGALDSPGIKFTVGYSFR